MIGLMLGEVTTSDELERELDDDELKNGVVGRLLLDDVVGTVYGQLSSKINTLWEHTCQSSCVRASASRRGSLDRNSNRIIWQSAEDSIAASESEVATTERYNSSIFIQHPSSTDH